MKIFGRSSKRSMLTIGILLLTLFSHSMSFASGAGKYLMPSAPTKITIPALHVTADIIKLGLDDQGALEVPKGADIAGWYKGSPSPGEIGPTIIVAHVDMNGKLGVFFNLKKLKAGDVIQVVRADRKIVSYTVTSTATYLKSKFPTEKIYGNIDHAGLRLITCGGKFNNKIGHYESNVVVYAKADLKS